MRAHRRTFSILAAGLCLLAASGWVWSQMRPAPGPGRAIGSGGTAEATPAQVNSPAPDRPVEPGLVPAAAEPAAPEPPRGSTKAPVQADEGLAVATEPIAVALADQPPVAPTPAVALAGQPPVAPTLAAAAPPLPAPPSVESRPGAALPLASPVLPQDLKLKAQRVRTWSDGPTRWLLLEQEVSLAVATYGFRASRAAVRIDTQTDAGGTIRHVSAYLDQAQPLGGQGPVQAQAPRLLVTVSVSGQVDLAADSFREVAVPDDPLVMGAAERFDRHWRSMAQALPVPDGLPLWGPQGAALRLAIRQAIQSEQEARQPVLPQVVRATTQPAWVFQPPPARAVGGTADSRAPAGRLTPPALGPIFSADGVVGFTAEKVIIRADNPREIVVVLMGGVKVVYDARGQGRDVALQAESAVLFVAREPAPATGPATEGAAASPLRGQQVAVDKVRGIYLEDNVVATDGQYTVRAPRVFYDVPRNRALLLDAVLFTYEPTIAVPLYVRAERLRQESSTSWSAQRALVTTSEFAEPHVALGVSRLSFAQETTADGRARQRFTAENLTARVGGAPVFWWPLIAGETEGSALQGLRANVSSQDGLVLQTSWDLFALAGRAAPEGVRLSGRLDWRGDHLFGAGADLGYDLADAVGQLSAYLLPYDDGTDEIGGRSDVHHDGDTRGHLHWRHRQVLPDFWTVHLEAGFVSDPTYLEEFFRDLARQDRPWETSIYVKRQQEDHALDVLLSYSLNDFATQTTALQAPGYATDKLPEIGYHQVATSLWDDRLTYFGQTQVSVMKLRLGDDRPADRGFTDPLADRFFGLTAGQRFSERFPTLPDDFVVRLDTRHEVQAPLRLGMFDLTPYLAGRVTAYDQDFDAMPGDPDQARLWGALGARAHTQVARVLDDLDSPVFDLHRLRHVIEPSADLFLAGASADSEDYPVFDSDVEALAEGFGLRLGLRNTLQTQRGGDGRWRSVDWLVLDTDLVLRSNDAPTGDRLARFFDYRPEYSLGGDHFYSRLMWRVSESLAASAESTYSLETSRVEQWRTGAALEQSPRLTLYADYSDVVALHSRLLSFGLTYELTSLYTVGVRQSLDLAGGDAQTLELSLERRLPRWRLLLLASYDTYNDETTVGVLLLPEGLSSKRLLSPLVPEWRE